MKAFYTIQEFAAELGMHPNTIRSAILRGKISALRLGGSQRVTYRIPHSEIERLAVVNLNEIVKKMTEK